MSEAKIRVNLVEAPIDRVFPNVWNPNKQSDFIFEKELQSIRTHGFIDPILVREISEGFEIVDGEHRYRAAKVLGMNTIPVNNLGTVSDSVAKQLTIIMNETRGQAERTSLAKLVQDISSTVSVEEMLANLPFAESEIDALMRQTHIDWTDVGAGGANGANGSNGDPKDGTWRTVEFRLPEGVADQLDAQVDRFKRLLHPEESNVAGVSPVLAVEAMCQHLAQLPDERLI